ncbi:MAG: type 1 glutamine amidotransferase domain-containing protein [Bacteroidales bacterium]
MKNKKVLFVLTSNGELGKTGKPTGWWISEASHPWKALTQAGYEIDYVSPKGGEPDKIGEDPTDLLNKQFLENSEVQRKLKNTLTPQDINIDDYCAIHFVGGHGAMWDLPYDVNLAKITAKFWEQGKVISAICHGVAALLNVKLRGGEYLVKGKDLTSFNDMEEKAIDMCSVIPYFLQCELMMRGARYHLAREWADNVQVHERLITAQNPQSGKSLGSALVAMLEHLHI